MSFIKEQHIKLYKKAIDTIRNDLGRNIIIVMEDIKAPCPNCGFDHTNEMSDGFFTPDDPYPGGIQGKNKLIGPQEFKNTYCPVCENDGMILTPGEPRETEALVEWLSTEDKERLLTGRRIKADVELRSVLLEEKKYFLIAKHFIVDDEILYLEKFPIPEGLRDLIKFSCFLKKESETKEESYAR